MDQKLENPPSPEEAEINELEKRVNSLLKKIDRIIQESPSTPSKCFGDIIMTFKGMFDVWEDVESRNSIRNIIKNNLEITRRKVPRIEKYLELIEKIPDFKAGESDNMTGAYPDLYEEASQEKMRAGKDDPRSRSEIYIDKVIERLNASLS